MFKVIVNTILGLGLGYILVKICDAVEKDALEKRTIPAEAEVDNETSKVRSHT